MNDETIRTRALTYTRNNPKVVIAYLITGCSLIWNAGTLLGHKQAGTEMLATTVKTLSDKVDALSGKVDGIALSQAEMRGQMEGVVKFQSDVTEGIKDARKVTVPTLTGRRARKP